MDNSTTTAYNDPTPLPTPTPHHASPVVAFIIGLAIILLASILNAAGLNLTKLDHVWTSAVPKSARKKDWMRPLWLLGMLLYILSQLIGSTLALEYMRAEYVAPLGSTSLVFNFLFARFLVGTPVTRNDIYGTIVVIAGVIGIVAFGSINSGLATETDAAHLTHLWRRGGWLGFFFFMTFSLWALYMFTSKLDAILAARGDVNSTPFAGAPPSTALPNASGPKREGQEISFLRRILGLFISLRRAWDAGMAKMGEWLEYWTAAKDDKQIAWTLGIGWACCGGGLAGGCLVFAKASVQLISGALSHENTGNQFGHASSIFTFIFLAITAVTQIICLNKGLKVYDSTLVVPVFYGVYTASGFLDSLIFNNEVDAYQSWTLFLIFVSILILISGVVLLTHKKPEAHKAKASPAVPSARPRPGPKGDDYEDDEAGEEHALHTRAEGDDSEAFWAVGDASDDEDDDFKRSPRPKHASSSRLHLGEEGTGLISASDTLPDDLVERRRADPNRPRRSMSSDATLPVSSARDVDPFKAADDAFGDKCRFKHDTSETPAVQSTITGASRPVHVPVQGALPAIEPQLDTAIAPRPAPVSRPKRGEIPCKAWRSGSCAKGAKCWFGHDLQPITNAGGQEATRRQQRQRQVEARARRELEEREQARVAEEVQTRVREERERERRAEEERIKVQEEVERARREEEERIRAQEERARQARLAELEAQRRIREAEQRVRLEEVARAEARKTTQRFVLGSLVTFGAGIDVAHFLAGFECCTVQIKGLPPNATDEDIASIFLDQGIHAGSFQVLENRPGPGGKRLAKVVANAEQGEAISIGLEDLDFGDSQLSFEVGSLNLPGGMGVSKPRELDVLTISWRIPSVRYVATFWDPESTRQWMTAADGQMLLGRRVKAQLNRPPTGRVLSSYNPNSIMLSNLDPSVSTEILRPIIGPLAILKRLDNGTSRVPNDQIISSLKAHIGNLSQGLVSFEEKLTPQKQLDGIVVTKARFDSWDAANQVHQSLSDGAFSRSMGLKESQFWVNLPNPMQYTLTMPTAQHSAQEEQWNSMLVGLTDRKACNLTRFVDKEKNVVRIRLTGHNKEAIGALKVRIERLAAGETIDKWHPMLGFSRNQFIASVIQETGGYLRADFRSKNLRVYGKPDVIASIRAKVDEELANLTSKEWHEVLPRHVVGYFIRSGIPSLKEMFGDDCVHFNASSRTITVRGEDARHTLKTLITQAIQVEAARSTTPDGATCPVANMLTAHLAFATT
ncbi:hypothetical protein ONZ45_g11128 [Pleurotus djamor]|nr:hypothetical protein ONZ45_g11128 [Pleurotus djamor]